MLGSAKTPIEDPLASRGIAAGVVSELKSQLGLAVTCKQEMLSLQ